MGGGDGEEVGRRSHRWRANVRDSIYLQSSSQPHVFSHSQVVSTFRRRSDESELREFDPWFPVDVPIEAVRSH